MRRGEPFAVLKASTLRAQQEEQEKEEPNRVRLTVGAPDSPRPGRTVSVNGGAVKRAASLAGSFPAVVFDPGHLSLVKGAPEGRRKFLDAALCQLYPGYLTLYRRYIQPSVRVPVKGKASFPGRWEQCCGKAMNNPVSTGKPG